MQKLGFVFLIVLISCGKGNDPKPKNQLYFPPLNSSEWETVSPATLGWDEAAVSDLDDFVETTNTRALIILKDGKLAYEKYHGNTITGTAAFTSSSYWYWASAGKTLTSFLIGQLEGVGNLSVTDPAADYLGDGWTDLTPQQEAAITVGHQLTMTSGLDYTVPNNDCTDPACLTYLNAPGTTWYYHNAPYTRLDGVIEGASGQSFDDYFEEHLMDPIGMQGFWTYNDFNHVFYSTPRSMARFGLLILAKGDWAGVSILDNPTYYEDMITPSQSLNPSYGYLWWLNGQGMFVPPGSTASIPSDITPNAPDEMFAAMGKNGQIINVVPSKGLVIVRMGDDPDTGLVPFTFQDDLWMILNEMLAE